MLGDEKSEEFFSESKREGKRIESKSSPPEGADTNQSDATGGMHVGQLLDANFEVAGQNQTSAKAKNTNEVTNEVVMAFAYFLTHD